MGQPLPPRLAPDLGDPADRALHAWRFYRAGKAEHVVISGGNMPWQRSVAPEAELIADFLVELGVPRSALYLDVKSRNTRENALNAAEIFAAQGWQTGLLVTSGSHMPRALAAFRDVGLDLTPAATDIRVQYPIYDSLIDFLPDAEGLSRTTAAIREMIGMQVYRYRGWA
jgi:uncharacterized SAM-binding protein YcdF (DUF218 family)